MQATKPKGFRVAVAASEHMVSSFLYDRPGPIPKASAQRQTGTSSLELSRHLGVNYDTACPLCQES